MADTLVLTPETTEFLLVQQQQQQQCGGSSNGKETKKWLSVTVVAPADDDASSWLESDKLELLLQDNPHRFVLFPIQHKHVWKFYKKAMASFWTSEEIDMGTDVTDWTRLTNNERWFIAHGVCFCPSLHSLTHSV